MKYEKTFQLEIRTEEDAKKPDEMRAAGWQVVDNREPPHSFYLLDFDTTLNQKLKRASSRA